MTELIVRYVKIGIAFAIFWAALIFWTSCSYKEIKGKEMAPGLVPGKNYWILIKDRTPDKLALEDIVAFEDFLPGSGTDKETVRAGRIHGLPGQRVKMVKGDLFVNGRKAATALGKGDESFEEIIVPRDSFFILMRSEEHTSELQSQSNLVCRLLLEKKKKK